MIETAAALRQELDGLERRDERAAALDAELDGRAPATIAASPETLSEGAPARPQRVRATRSRRRWRDLAMARTRCEVRFVEPERAKTAGPNAGIDEAEFYISPNPGEDLRPLARIASGGELSRIMLALKTLASTDAPGKTLIFDEVDAGIGGAVADVVGARLQQLADARPGALHHAPAADRRVRDDALPDREDASRTGGRSTGVAPLGVREREDGARADDRRRRGVGRRSGPARARC